MLVSGLALVIGAVGEYLEEHEKLPRWTKWPFIAIVVASLIGEFAGDAGVYLFSDHLQTINDMEANALRERIKSEIDARLVLEEQVLEQGPRDLMLSGKRAEKFVESLRQFEGQKVQIRICQFNSNEIRDAAERLTALFDLAKWMVSPNSPNWGEVNCVQPPNPPIPSGIWIGTPSATPDDATQGRAKKLLEFLQAVPLVAVLHPVRPDTVRGESGKSIPGQYGDPDSIVVVVLSHSFERSTPSSPTNGGIIF